MMKQSKVRPTTATEEEVSSSHRPDRVSVRSKSLDSSLPILKKKNNNNNNSQSPPQNNSDSTNDDGGIHGSLMSWFVTRPSSSSSPSPSSPPSSPSSPSSSPPKTLSWSLQTVTVPERGMPDEDKDMDDDDFDDDDMDYTDPLSDSDRSRVSTSRFGSARPSLLTVGRMFQSNKPVSLEGTLKYRKSRSAAGNTGWKYAYVVLDLDGYGSLTCFKEKPVVPSSTSKPGYSSSSTYSSDSGLSWESSKIKRSLRYATRPKRGNTKPQMAAKSLRNVHNLSLSKGNSGAIAERFHLPSHVNWVVKNVENTSTEFVIEIPTDMPTLPIISSDDADGGIPKDILEDFERARSSGKPFRVYFACAHKSNEKMLWLQAFGQLDRLSPDAHSKRGLQTLFDKKVRVTHRRIRTKESHDMASAGEVLDFGNNYVEMSESSDFDKPPHRLPGVRQSNSERKEFLVYPTYAYPNQWMTEKELYTEMLKPTETFHDLRRSVTGGCSNGKKEIGNLKVEVLQCIGLPSLDFASETDAVTYLVCGSYAFATDVIWDRLNPMWLPKSRRACTFPIFHAYASLYAGVFDDDGKGEKDDFAGRVVLDLAQLRPRSTYDVTLPLRMSSHVYSKKSRGSIRLRFSIEWYSERDAILSYVPKSVRPPTSARPEDDVTVLCADEKAFRNVATVVHGDHMPGRFSVQELKATMREANFTRKVITRTVKDNIFEIVVWKNPVLSGIVFFAWMHCIYVGSFSLVPFYAFFFLFLTMVRTYAFYGSQGPLQQGFIPPSWEELLMALVKKDSHVIEPLKVRPRKNGAKTTPETYKEKTTWLMEKGLGFRTDLVNGEDEDYQLEFPYSQGLRDPITGNVCYPSFSVRESLVIKSKHVEKKKTDEDDESLGPSTDTTAVPGRPLSFLKRRKGEPSLDSTAKTFESISEEEDDGSTESRTIELSFPSNFSSPYKSFDELPLPLRMPEQNVNAPGPAKKKKLTQELQDLKGNLHKLTFHQFHHVTHVKPKDDSVYFGSAGRKGAKNGAQLEIEMEKLLNVGQFSAGNPVVARVGLYLEPILSAVQSGLAVSRVLYHILTWRDPILSFWATAAFLAAAIVLYIFPWRIFLFVAGVAVVGPQNYVMRVLDDHRLAPKPLQKMFDKMREPKKYTKKDVACLSAVDSVPSDQPILSCHTTDNSPPLELDPTEADPRELHQVCVPYSQLRSRRFYDWPPEPHYARCTPTATPTATDSPQTSSICMPGGSNNLSRSEHDRYRNMRRRVTAQ